MLKIVAVNSRKELLAFVKFNIELYKDSPYAVPPLILDDMNTLLRNKNTAYDFCEAQCFICYRDKKIVGRIAAIINHKANSTWGQQMGRFGFIDFIDDAEVVDLLINTAQSWVKERGMTSFSGPLGFTDMDKEGMLIEGFDQVGTIATNYNYPYYPEHLHRLGFTKAADWVEMKVFHSEQFPERIRKIANLVEVRSGLRVLRLKKTREIIKGGYGRQIFELVNEAFSKLYGYSALTDKQIDAYIKQYFPLARIEFITLIVDKDDKLVAFGIGLPSLAKAMQKSRGKLFPLGWYYLLKALKSKHCPVIDFMLIAIHPSFQGKGVNAIIMREFDASMRKCATEYAESNPELEDNNQVQDQWDSFETVKHKRRRAFIRSID